MKLLTINGGSSGSSWNIMLSAAQKCRDIGWDVLVCTPNVKPKNLTLKYYQIDNRHRSINNLLTKIDGSDGFRNDKATKNLINIISDFCPDIVHLHTLHGYFINVDMLCSFLKKNNIRTVITMHDCWYFTGRCAHFTSFGCFKWIKGCNNCEHKTSYPKSMFFDKSSKYYSIKKRLFSNWSKLNIVAVSNWLASTAKQSDIFSNIQDIQTVYNGVDTDVFCDKNRDYGSSTNDDIKIICVSSLWNEKKGLPIINYVAEKLPSKYKITLVGNVGDKNVSNKINYIGSVNSKEQLAELYLKSDFLLNPSLEETFSLVNIEAQACGNRVICYPNTGLEETSNNDGNILVERYDGESFYNAIIKIQQDTSLNKKCAIFAKDFSKENMVKQYLDIYKN